MARGRHKRRAGARRGPLLLAIGLGVVAGLGSAWWVMKHGSGGEVHAHWAGNRVTGATDADPWTRAQVALTGLLALNRSQAIYFRRDVDDSGARLRADCRYRVSGGALPGRWWSVTVYAADDYLPLNDDDALSFDATEVRPDAKGRWSATVSPAKPGEGAWASSRNAGNFDLTLRIYNPSLKAQGDFASIPFPRVERIDCDKGAGA